MNVLHVTRDFPPRHHGGISTAVGGLARAQSRAGLGVAVLSFDAWRPCAGTAASAPPPVEAADGIAVLRLRSAEQLPAARDLRHRAAARPRCTCTTASCGEFAAALRAELRVPVVQSVHVVQRYMNELRGTRERTLSLAGEEAALAAADRVDRAVALRRRRPARVGTGAGAAAARRRPWRRRHAGRARRGDRACQRQPRAVRCSRSAASATSRARRSCSRSCARC